MLKHVDLCSGIGGFALGFEWAGLSQPILFCDTDEWCRKVLNKHWPDVPIANDVKDFANEPDRIPDCDIITAGYPCQPFSVAGEQKGTEDDRHIWPYIHQIVAHKRPAWCVFENVYGHVALGLDQVLLDLETEGYAARTFVVPACSVDAPHRRDRLWIVGNTQHNGLSAATVTRSTEEAGRRASQGQDTTVKSQGASRPDDDEAVAYANDQRPQGWVSGRQDTEWQGVDGHAGCSGAAHGQSNKNQRPTQSRLGGMANGIPDWLDEPDDIPRVSTGQKDRTNRLKGLGNAIVPQIAMQIGLTIKSQIVEKQ